MRSVRRKIMAVVAVIGVAVVAGLTLAKSWPFTGGSKPSAAMGSTVVRKLGARAAAGALDRLPAPMTGYARARFGQAWTDNTDQGLTRSWGCNDALARTKPGSRCVITSGTLHDPYTGATLAWRRGRHASTTVQIDLGNAWVTGVEKTAMTRILNRCSGLSGTPKYATMGL